ncbi:MAG: protease HtpX [Gammaproteobacteria bacterium]|nr:protease HtpX [Gammaproteobacteria bacterium]
MRIGLLLLTNLAVMLIASVVFSLLGLSGILDADGIGLNLGALLVWCALLGFGGSFVSLALSKWMAKRATRAAVIEAPGNETENWLLDTVARLAEDAGIGMPEVAIFPSPQPNAFATGATSNSALVAVSSGLLQQMNQDEVEAVLGHEIGHIANGDMLTLTLIQGVVNTFVILLSRVVGYVVDRYLLRNETGLGIGYFVTSIAAQIFFGILASAIVMWFSRRREFRADARGAELAGREKMISALERLRAASRGADTMPQSMAAFGISAGTRRGIRALYSSHPPLETRIAALRAGE